MRPLPSRVGGKEKGNKPSFTAVAMPRKEDRGVLHLTSMKARKARATLNVFAHVRKGGSTSLPKRVLLRASAPVGLIERCHL